MQLDLRIAVWNANGLQRKLNEISLFLNTKHIDIFLISETHLTSRSHIKIRGYDFISTNHPDDSAHAGAGLFVKSSIRYEIATEYRKPYLQASGIRILCNHRSISVYAIYFPPRHSVSSETYVNFFRNLGHRFIVAGDFNAKHPWWGSRLINPKGRNLYRCIIDNHYKTLSGGKPTYWPTDPKKIPDLLDFAVYSGICSNSLDIINDDNLPSDHTPILINYSTQVELSSANVKLITSKTNLNFYGEWVDKNIDLKTSIKTGEELDDTVESFTSLIHEAAVLSTPEIEAPLHPGHKVQSSAYIRQFIKYKRSLRRIWKRTRNPSDKTKWNLACKSCTELLEKERSDNTSQYLQKLSPRRPNQEDYIFNATKYLKKKRSN